MNRLQKLFQSKSKDILNIYITAGFPALHDTVSIVKKLDKAGVDIVEIGMPYSDPLADGETIQKSSMRALENGMNLSVLFEQVKEIRKEAEVPIVLMGYFNQLLQYGIERFLMQCESVGVDGLIIPDLPIDIYEMKYKALFDKSKLRLSFLITPQTPADRIKKIDLLSDGFIYMVSVNATTGTERNIDEQYFERIHNMDLNNPRLIGFGIKDRAGYEQANRFANGAIIGSAFIRHVDTFGAEEVATFINSIR